MTQRPNDVVVAAAGRSDQVEAWGQVVRAAGVECRVAAAALAGGLGSARQGSGELLARREDLTAAAAALNPEPPPSRRANSRWQRLIDEIETRERWWAICDGIMRRVNSPGPATGVVNVASAGPSVTAA